MTNDFPSYVKAYQYKGGFNKFVYDKLKELSGESEEDNPTSEEPNEEFTPVTYSFTSYGDANGETEYATGTVETTGNTSGNYIEVEVKSNSVDGFVGNKYYIISTAKTDGTIYKLYTDGGRTSADIWVSISSLTE